MSRAILAIIGVLTLEVFSGVRVADVEGLARVFLRGDAGWYLDIAKSGYSTADHPLFHGQTRYGYLPAFPLAVRFFVWTTGFTPLTAGLIVSNTLLASGLALVVEYALLLGSSLRVGIAAALLICFAPHSFVFSSPHTESLFLFLLAGSMLTLRRRLYGLSGLLAGLLSAVRVNGVFFALFAFAFLLRRDGIAATLDWRRPERFLPIILAPLGIFAFWWYCFASTGDAFAQSSTLSAGWHWATDWPWDNAFRILVHGSPTQRFWLSCSLALFSCSFLLIAYGWYEEFLLCLCTFVLDWSGTSFDSIVRHGIVLFPIFIALARFLEPRPNTALVVAGTLALLDGMLMVSWEMAKAIAQ